MTRRNLTWTVLVLAVIVGGCSAGAKMATNAHPLGRGSIHHFADAHRAFANSLVASGQRTDNRQYIPQIEQALRMGISASSTSPGDASSYRCPLFSTLLGDQMLMEPTLNLEAAYDAYDNSVDDDTGLVEWIPGYIGLANWATLSIPMDSAKADIAEDFLVKAEEQLSKLVEATENQHRRAPITPFCGVLRLYELHDDEETDDDSARLDQSARLRLVWNWMLAYEQWWEPAWNLPNHGALPAEGVISALDRRLRARISYQRAMIRRLKGDPSDYVRHMLKNEGRTGALDKDVNFWPARALMASLLRQSGHFADAESQLTPIVSETTSLLANNPKLRLELAAIFVDWFARDKRLELAERADAEFATLLNQIAPGYADAWLEDARFRLILARFTGLSGEERAQQIQQGMSSLTTARRLGAAESSIAELHRDLVATGESL